MQLKLDTFEHKKGSILECGFQPKKNNFLNARTYCSISKIQTVNDPCLRHFSLFLHLFHYFCTFFTIFHIGPNLQKTFENHKKTRFRGGVVLFENLENLL